MSLYRLISGIEGFLSFLFLMTRYAMKPAIRARAATPPTTPPTMAPIGGDSSSSFNDCVGVGTGGIDEEAIMSSVVGEAVTV